MPKEDDAIRQAEYLLENISKSLDSIASSIREGEGAEGIREQC